MRQPPGSNVCGQTCLAMLSGLPVSQLQRLIRKKGCTRPQDLMHGLELLGKRNVEKRQLPPTAIANLPAPSILRMQWEGGSHWVIWNGEHIFDPVIGKPASLAGFKRFRLERHASRFNLAITWVEPEPVE